MKSRAVFKIALALMVLFMATNASADLTPTTSADFTTTFNERFVGVYDPGNDDSIVDETGFQDMFGTGWEELAKLEKPFKYAVTCII